MSDPLDLDALDCSASEWCICVEGYACVWHTLFAELRECRAERDQALLAATIQGASAREQCDRAERAEAAIARVEALCDGWSDPGRGYVSVAGVRAALRGDPVP